ncbi:MAG: hypothetical protein IKV88_08870, partial [Clostridia bacterium]|nr:hypothetical protein [Clostridia bacterium]
HGFSPELTLRIAKKHREMGIKSQWKIFSDAEHGFFHKLHRPVQKMALEDFCKFLDGELETEF